MPATFEIVAQGRDNATPAFVALGETIQTLSEKGAAGLDALSQASARSLTAVQKQADSLRTSATSLGLGLTDLNRKLDLGSAGAAAARELQRYETALKQGIITQAEFAAAQAKITANFSTMASGGFVQQFEGGLKSLISTGLAPLATVSPAAASGIEGLVAKIGPAGLLVGGLAGGALAAGGAIFGLAKSAADSGDAITALSTRTGVGVTTLSSLGLQAKLSNTNLDTLAAGMRNAEDVFASAVSGNAQAAQSFQTLGLDLRQLLNLKPEERFEAISKSIVALPNNFEQVAAGVNVFGKSFLELRPLIADVAEKGLPAIVKQGEEVGVVTDDMAARQVELSKRLTMAEASWSSLWNTIKQGAVEATIAVTDFVKAPANLTSPAGVLLPGMVKQTGLPGRGLSTPGLGGVTGDFGGAEGGGGGGTGEGGTLPSTRQQLADLEKLRQATREAAADRVAAEQAADGNILAAAQSRYQKERDLLGRDLGEKLKALDTEFAVSEDRKAAQTELIAQYGEKQQALYTKQAQETTSIVVQSAQAASAALAQIGKKIDDTFISKDVKAEIEEVFGAQAFAPAISGIQKFTDGIVAAGKAGEQIKALNLGKSLVDPSDTARLHDFDKAITDTYADAEKGAAKAGLSTSEFNRALGSSAKVAGDAAKANKATADSLFTVDEAGQRTATTYDDLAKQIAEGATSFSNQAKSATELSKGLDTITSEQNVFAKQADDLVGSNADVATSFGESADAVDRYRDSLDQAARSAKGLEDVQTTHSLEPSTIRVADAMGDASTAAGSMAAGFGAASAGASALDARVSSLAATLRSGVQSALSQMDDELTKLASPYTSGTKPGGGSSNVKGIYGQYGYYNFDAIQLRAQQLMAAGAGSPNSDAIARTLAEAGLTGVTPYATSGKLPGGGSSTPLLGAFAGNFADGGIVPGSPGEPKWAIVHGGEVIAPAGAGGITITVGDIHVASGEPGQIHAAVLRAIQDGLRDLTRRRGRPVAA